jgi:hypothetical protein
VFWLTEFGVAARVAENRISEVGALLTWELGWMVNRGAKSAFGVAAFAELGALEVGVVGIRPRLRIWLSGSTSLDIAPGVGLLRSESPAKSFSGHVALNLADYSAVTAHVVVLPSGARNYYRTPHVAVFAGGRLGSTAGSVVGIALPVAYVILLAIACGGGGCWD